MAQKSPFGIWLMLCGVVMPLQGSRFNNPFGVDRIECLWWLVPSSTTEGMRATIFCLVRGKNFKVCMQSD